MSRPLVPGLVLATIALATPGGATTAGDLCGTPVPDPCIVTTPHAVEDGSTLDFGTGALILRTSSGQLDVGAGSMTIEAGSVTLETAAKLLGAGGTIVVRMSGAPGSITVAAGARIDVSAAGAAGSIELDAAGDVAVDGDLRANGTSSAGYGGAVHVAADGAVRLADVLASGGATFPTGWRAAIGATAGGALTLNGVLDVSHGECVFCEIDLAAGGDLTTAKRIAARATDGGGDGGAVTVTAGGSVQLGNDVTVQAGGSDGVTGGSGGDVSVQAGGDILVIGSLLLGGSAPDGDGGTFDLEAGRDVAQGPGSVFDAEAGGDGCGGSPTSIAAGRDVSLEVVRLGGGSCDAGALDVGAGRDCSLLGTIEGNASADGDGADVRAVAGGTLTVDGDIRVSGTTAGSGGSIYLEGCDLTVVAGVQLLADGDLGSEELAAHGQLTMNGTLEAGDDTTLRFGEASLPPAIGGPVRPPATPVLDPSLTPCGQAHVCGNGTVESPEECDDGNTDSCDGCSATCTREACGNGRVDCGEDCDPPDGERCDTSCRAIPTPVQRFPGSTKSAGCQAEWEVENAKGTLNPTTGLPERIQACADGDPACDGDGVANGVCSFRARLCLGVNDSRLACHPAAIDHVTVRDPSVLDPGNPTDAANGQTLVDALEALGVGVRAGSAVIRTGTPDAIPGDCTPSFTLLVPHGTGVGRRRFNVAAADVAGHRMTGNAIRLDCLPSLAVCGDGTVDPASEECEDGNAAACDGCSPACHREWCGNGVVDCGEQCDDGPFGGAPHDGCTATCRDVAPTLRIPGGGAAATDCALEWAPVLGSAPLAVDSRGVPRNRQACVDGDPACDLDPTPGTCRLRVFACVGGGDARLGCAPAQVTDVTVVRPTAGPVRDALVAELHGIPLPAGPGETCTGSVTADVPARTQLRLTTRARLASGGSDGDKLKLKCLGPR